VRFILYPLSKKSSETQVKMRKIEPKMREIRETFKDKQEQGLKMMALYKENKLNPLSGILLLLIQFPIIIALYWVFRGEIASQSNLLYSFVSIPENVSNVFLGFIDLSVKNIWLAILVGLSQFLVMHITMPKTAPTPPKADGSKPSFQDDFAKSMQFQMRYFLPPFIAFIAYGIGGPISLYWITSNCFQLVQEMYIKRKLDKQG
jgi:YidC/Oxa1 family membrane protein insertase